MRIVKKLKALYRIMKAFMDRPQLSCVLFRQVPIIIQGVKYAQSRQPYNASFPFFNPQPASDSHHVFKRFEKSHKEGKGIWKWLHYFDIYQEYFEKFVGREVHILEIGVYSGGSLEMWRNCFGSKCHVYGVDIEKDCMVYENEYTKIFIGDQADRNFWKLFKEKVPVIDILIDDGGHQVQQRMVTLEEMLPFLSPGGVYLCEDIHGHENDFIPYLFGMVQTLNEKRPQSYDFNTTQFQRWIKSIRFYPYVAVIEKFDRPKEKLSAPKQGTQWQPFYKY